MEPELDEREQKIQIREAWRKARDEMREAFRTTWQEGVAENDTLKRENFEAFVQNLAAKASEFGREVGEEARRLSQGFAHDAHHHADEAWKGVRAEWQERHQENSDRHHRPAGVRDHWLFGNRRFQNWAEGDGDANPFLAAMMSKGGGLLSAYVLHLLAEQPRHGNDLMKEIESRTLGNWTSNPGAIYPLLSSMESNGLVVSNWEEPERRTRRIYKITGKGQDEIGRLKQVLRPKLMDTIDVLNDIYDDLYGSQEQEPAPSRDEVQGAQEDTPPANESAESGSAESQSGSYV